MEEGRAQRPTQLLPSPRGPGSRGPGLVAGRGGGQDAGPERAHPCPWHLSGCLLVCQGRMRHMLQALCIGGAGVLRGRGHSLSGNITETLACRAGGWALDLPSGYLAERPPPGTGTTQ